MSNEKKNNFSKAAYDMFGIGKAEKAESSEKAEKTVQKVVTSVVEEKPETEKKPVAEKAAPVFRAPVEKKRTYLAAGSSMEGTMKVDGDLEILGDFKGTLEVTGEAVIHSNIEAAITAANLTLVSCALTGDCHVSGKVVVDEKSTVNGNITVENLDCAGKVKGDIHAGVQAVFRASSRLEGNVETKGISVEPGAVLMGNIKM